VVQSVPCILTEIVSIHGGETDEEDAETSENRVDEPHGEGSGVEVLPVGADVAVEFWRRHEDSIVDVRIEAAHDGGSELGEEGVEHGEQPRFEEGLAGEARVEAEADEDERKSSILEDGVDDKLLFCTTSIGRARQEGASNS